MRAYYSRSKDINKTKENSGKKALKKNRSSYYQKIYAIHSENEEENKVQNKSALRLKKIQEKKNKMNSLIKVFQGPKKDEKNAPRWPKVTHPKLPFTNIRNEDPETKKKRIELLKPSRLYHDFHTIQWLRKKYSDSVIEKSVFSILPENGRAKIPLNESEAKKRQRKMIEFLESFKGPLGKEKYVKINPKYLYNETTYDKIKKLKEIFLEFDGSGYRKMEMNELVSLFNQNNIPADIKELVSLFFKDKKVKKGDYSKLYLNFYQFLTFALTQEHDFRQFMRKIKEKYNKKGEEEENKDKDAYLPMNINLVLDYFINKGKERSSIEKIEKAINEMDNLIQENSLINNHESKKELISDFRNKSNISNKNKQKNKNFKSSENSKINQTRRDSFKELSYTLGNINSSKDGIEQRKFLKKYNENEEKFDKIDFKQLIQEFSNLFNYNGLKQIEEKKSIYNKTIIKKIKKNNFKNRINNFNKARRKSQENKNITTLNFLSPTNNTNFRKIFYNNSQSNKVLSDTAELYELIYKDNESLGNAIKQQMNENTILKMNVKNYEKLHDIKLALDATKSQIKGNNKNLNKNYRSINLFKKSCSQGEVTNQSNLNKKDYKYSLNNEYKKIDIFNNRSKKLPILKTNSVKRNRNELTIINNKSINNNFLSDNNNYSKTNRTFLNVFCGKSQLVNMSQEQTDYASKSKFDYVPPEFLFI